METSLSFLYRTFGEVMFVFIKNYLLISEELFCLCWGFGFFSPFVHLLSENLDLFGGKKTQTNKASREGTIVWLPMNIFQNHSLQCLPSLLLIMKGGRVLLLFYQVSTKCVVPISFKKKKTNSEISPSFPLRFKLACVKWKSAANKGEKMNSSMSDVKQIYLLCQKTTRDKGHDELKT